MQPQPQHSASASFSSTHVEPTPSSPVLPHLKRRRVTGGAPQQRQHLPPPQSPQPHLSSTRFDAEFGAVFDAADLERILALTDDALGKPPEAPKQTGQQIPSGTPETISGGASFTTQSTYPASGTFRYPSLASTQLLSAQNTRTQMVMSIAFIGNISVSHWYQQMHQVAAQKPPTADMKQVLLYYIHYFLCC